MGRRAACGARRAGRIGRGTGGIGHHQECWRRRARLKEYAWGWRVGRPRVARVPSCAAPSRSATPDRRAADDRRWGAQAQELAGGRAGGLTRAAGRDALEVVEGDVGGPEPGAGLDVGLQLLSALPRGELPPQRPHRRLLHAAARRSQQRQLVVAHRECSPSQGGRSPGCAQSHKGAATPAIPSD